MPPTSASVVSPAVDRGFLTGEDPHMKSLRVVLIVLACLLLAAHFSRAGNNILAVLSLLLPLLLLVGKPWARVTLRIALVLGGLEWVRTLVRLVSERRGQGEDWMRMAVILGIVALVTFLAAQAVRISAAIPDRDPPAG